MCLFRVAHPFHPFFHVRFLLTISVRVSRRSNKDEERISLLLMQESLSFRVINHKLIAKAAAAAEKEMITQLELFFDIFDILRAPDPEFRPEFMDRCVELFQEQLEPLRCQELWRYRLWTGGDLWSMNMSCWPSWTSLSNRG